MQFPDEEDTDGSRNVASSAVLPYEAATGPSNYYRPTPQHISLWAGDIIIHRNRDIHGYVNEGTFCILITLPLPNRAHFIFTGWHQHKYLLTCTLKAVNQFCAQTKQRYCATNGNLRLCKTWYLQYVNNKTPVSSHTPARLVRSNISATETWAFKQFCLKMCKSIE